MYLCVQRIGVDVFIVDKHHPIVIATEKLSDELNIGKTTIRIILQTLGSAGLIFCGRPEDKGILAEIAIIGNIVINRLNGEETKHLEVIK